MVMPMSQPNRASAGPSLHLPLPGMGWWHVATAVVALAWLVQGPLSALGAAVGGLAIAAGTWLFRHIALGGGVQSSAGAMGRLLTGLMFKWVVVVGGLAAGVALGLPPMPVLTGVLAALVAQIVSAITGPARTGKAI